MEVDFKALKGKGQEISTSCLNPLGICYYYTCEKYRDSKGCDFFLFVHTCLKRDTAPKYLFFRKLLIEVLGAKETRRQHKNLDARLALATIRPVQTELN